MVQPFYGHLVKVADTIAFLRIMVLSFTRFISAWGVSGPNGNTLKKRRQVEFQSNEI